LVEASHVSFLVDSLISDRDLDQEQVSEPEAISVALERLPMQSEGDEAAEAAQFLGAIRGLLEAPLRVAL
jgi:hypothetical protein